MSICFFNFYAVHISQLFFVFYSGNSIKKQNILSDLKLPADKIEKELE